MIKLSVLTMTTPKRLETFCPKLIRDLERQIGDRVDVEILCLYDNKKRTVGHKRNNMVQLAQGEFLTFIDDDDRIAPEYIDSIMNCIYANPTADCIVFDCITQINGKYECLSKYGIEFEYGQNGDQWRGKPAHTMVYKASLAKAHIYKDIQSGEDIDWVKRACQGIKNQVRIDKILYYYDFDQKTTETRG